MNNGYINNITIEYLSKNLVENKNTLINNNIEKEILNNKDGIINLTNEMCNLNSINDTLREFFDYVKSLVYYLKIVILIILFKKNIII